MVFRLINVIKEWERNLEKESFRKGFYNLGVTFVYVFGWFLNYICVRLILISLVEVNKIVEIWGVIYYR